MSILAKIFDKIFPWADGNTPSPAQPTTPLSPGQTHTPEQPASTISNAPTEKREPASGVDVEKSLDDLARKSGQTLNWRTSIVDLLKLLDLDSSLQARKDLAQELDYPGDTNDTALMNTWLHKELMKTLAANGGKVPAELRE